MMYLANVVSALTEEKNTESFTSSEKANKNFCVENTLASSEIKVTVTGVGELTFPLNKAIVQKLIKVSTIAKFGIGENTVMDRNIRNTQMIESKDLNVSINQESLSRITSNIQEVLNLPKNSTLTPHLYNMLIYGPGQFFKKHRDSEKLPNMIATLVIILPSLYVGGELVIEHNDKKHIFSSENTFEESAKCICFYSDCIHEVKLVKFGYRVVLTFNVVMESSELTVADNACVNEKLRAAVQEYFNHAIKTDTPRKLVFFLNHTYSEHSLRWDLLKGEDYQYASNFRSVARELALDVHLVLANIHHCWASADVHEPEPDDLIHSDITLDCWMDANNMKLSYGEYSPMSSEICLERETDNTSFDPIEQEFAETTGNAGATVDYWYKRAAIVLWPMSDSLMVKFELNYNEAISELCTMTNVAGNEKKIKKILDKAAILSDENPTADNFESFAKIALYFKSKEEARTILSSFCSNILVPKNVHMLTRLQHQYGVDWLVKFFCNLQRRKGYFFGSSIASFVREFLNSGGDRSVLNFLLKVDVTSFIEQSANKKSGWNNFYYAGKTEDLERSRELFKASATIGNVKVQEKLFQYLMSQPISFPANELVKLYGQLQKYLPLENLDYFEVRLKEAVEKELPLQTRPADDWSISTVLFQRLFCNCEQCNIVMRFLHSKTDTKKSWCVNGNIHKHIKNVLFRSKVPVDVTIICEGRPFIIMLEKNGSLHTQAKRKRNELKTFLRTVETKTAEKKRPMEKDKGNKRQKL